MTESENKYRKSWDLPSFGIRVALSRTGADGMPVRRGEEGLEEQPIQAQPLAFPELRNSDGQVLMAGSGLSAIGAQ